MLNYKKPAFWVMILAVIACLGVAVCFLTNPKRDSYTIRIVVPAGSEDPFVYSQEEISPLKNYVIVSSGEGLGDTEVILKPVYVEHENVYEPAVYMTPGMPVKLFAEKGGWFQIGINMQNPTDQDKEVFVEVKYVKVRIEDGEESYPESETIPSSQEESQREVFEAETYTAKFLKYTVQEIHRGEGRTLVEMAEEDAMVLLQLLDRAVWTEGTTDCLSDCSLNLEGHHVYYHSGCGTFNRINLSVASTLSSKEPENTGWSYSLTEAEQEMANDILGKYIELE